ncbi:MULTISPECIES: hypothetical protein [unclassified Cupriavidus]|uniref:hypothetical protein n=1 Tax=unclassified Cupriavidus TaxID=2640874 RepID=UPI00313CBEE6
MKSRFTPARRALMFSGSVGLSLDTWDLIVKRLVLVLVLGMAATAAIADEEVPQWRTERPTHARKDMTRYFGVEYMYPAKGPCGSDPSPQARAITRVSKVGRYWDHENACALIVGDRVHTNFKGAIEITDLKDWVAGASMMTFWPDAFEEPHSEASK